MADDPFDEHRDELDDFENDMTDLCFDIIDAAYDTDNAYYATYPDLLDGIYAAPADYLANIIAPTPYDFDNDQFHHARFRRDIGDLGQVELPVFLDLAEPDKFVEAVTRLRRASRSLDEASGYSGFAELITLMDKWQGEAAYNFQRDVIPKFGVSVVHQLVFIDELIAVALCLHEVIERGRGDALGLAQDLKDKVEVDTTAIPLETVLWVAGSIAAGIATFGASAPATAAVVAGRIGFGIGIANGTLGAVRALSGGRTGDRAISGDTAYEFIPSCREQIERIIDKGNTEVETVMDALNRDLSGGGVDQLCISRPKILDGAAFELVDAAQRSEGYQVECLADLRFAGTVTLPTMAEYFNSAYGDVLNLSDLFDTAIGYAVVASTSRHILRTAIDTLAEAFEDTRDYLYRAGVTLTAIADEYFDREDLNQAMMESFARQLDEVDTEEFPRYTPTPLTSGR